MCIMNKTLGGKIYFSFIPSFFLLEIGITNVNIGFGGWVVCLETVVGWRFCSVVVGEFCFMEIDLNLLIRN